LKLLNFGKNVIILLKQKVAQKVNIILGYFILSKNHNEPPKVARLVKNCPIWSPCWVGLARSSQTVGSLLRPTTTTTTTTTWQAKSVKKMI